MYIFKFPYNVGKLLFNYYLSINLINQTINQLMELGCADKLYLTSNTSTSCTLDTY